MIPRHSAAAGRRVSPRRAAWAALAVALLAGACGLRIQQGSPHHPHGTQGVNHPAHRGKPVVVMISIDGFRASYLEELAPPALLAFAAGGARAEALVPAFPTLTFPAHYTIATGERAERHGIVANRMYDPASGARYSPADASVQQGFWYRGEPIWATAERQGMVSAIRYWPGSEAEIGGIRPSHWKAFDAGEPARSRLEQVLAWLDLPDRRRPHLVLAYLDTVDVVGHDRGPASPELAGAVRALDSELGEFFRRVSRLPIAERLYLILVADHGMAEFTPERHQALEDLADTVGVRGVQFGPVSNLFVDGGPGAARRLRDTLNIGLRGGRAWLREELPERFGYRADPRAGDVVVVMEQGHLFGRRATAPRAPGGAHGWDPAYPAMQGIFMVRGPGIPAGHQVPRIESVQIHRLISELLGIDPSPTALGEAASIRSLLTER